MVPITFLGAIFVLEHQLVIYVGGRLTQFVLTLRVFCLKFGNQEAGESSLVTIVLQMVQ